MAHRSITALKGACFSTQQAEVILDVVEEHSRDLATKADLQALELRLTLRMGALSAATIALMLAGVAALTRL